MSHLRFLHAIGAVLCGIAIICVVLNWLRPALALVIIVLFIFLWAGEVVRFRVASSSREIVK